MRRFTALVGLLVLMLTVTACNGALHQDNEIVVTIDGEQYTLYVQEQYDNGEIVGPDYSIEGYDRYSLKDEQTLRTGFRVSVSLRDGVFNESAVYGGNKVYEGSILQYIVFELPVEEAQRILEDIALQIKLRPR